MVGEDFFGLDGLLCAADDQPNGHGALRVRDEFVDAQSKPLVAHVLFCRLMVLL